MTRGCELPLESYRLAQYALQVPCYVCSGPNTFDSEHCRHCLAPMALAHQANSQKVHPQMVAVLGSSGVGKTVYLGMLMDMLSRQSANMQVLARGAFSITLQQMTTEALQRGEFPEKTPNEPDEWNWIHCVVSGRRRRRSAELIMPDMAGEAILEEIDHPNTYPVIRALLSRCSGVLILLDAIQLQEGSHEQEHFAMKLLSFLHELDPHPKHGWTTRPIGIVLTKADQVEECFRDAGQFVEEHAVGVLQYCRERFRRFNSFASGVAGSCAYRTVIGGRRIRVPLRIEPRGIREPFEWMVGELAHPVRLK